MLPGCSVAASVPPIPTWVLGPCLLESSRDAVRDHRRRTKTQF